MQDALQTVGSTQSRPHHDGSDPALQIRFLLMAPMAVLHTAAALTVTQTVCTAPAYPDTLPHWQCCAAAWAAQVGWHVLLFLAGTNRTGLPVTTRGALRWGPSDGVGKLVLA